MDSACFIKEDNKILFFKPLRTNILVSQHIFIDFILKSSPKV